LWFRQRGCDYAYYGEQRYRDYWVTLEVQLLENGKEALLLDEFYEDGAVVPNSPTATPFEQRWIDSVDDGSELE
jgi:hypothetical protein